MLVRTKVASHVDVLGSHASVVVPACSEEKISSPLVVYGLLPHENKTSVVHYVLRRTSNYTLPIKSKVSNSGQLVPCPPLSLSLSGCAGVSLWCSEVCCSTHFLPALIWRQAQGITVTNLAPRVLPFTSSTRDSSPVEGAVWPVCMVPSASLPSPSLSSTTSSCKVRGRKGHRGQVVMVCWVHTVQVEVRGRCWWQQDPCTECSPRGWCARGSS